MKIMVTGGAGFIGSAVIRLAIKANFQIINIDALTYAACLENLAGVSNHPKYTFEQADIRDFKKISDLMETHKPDSIMHLAAESHVDRSIDGPIDFVTTNVIGTFNLLEASKNHWLASGKPEAFRFHHVSTDEVYGSLGESGKFTEQTPYDPRSPYSATKASSDHLVRAWHETYGLPIVVTNCSNNYGPFQFPEKLIPVIIINALSGKPIPIYGDGKNIRDWLYVEEHAEALLSALSHGRNGRTYNIGGDNEASNIDIVRTICGILDRKRPGTKPYAELITFVNDRPGHDRRYSINASRISEELNWQPTVTLDVGLEKTVDWYLKNEDWWQALLEREGVGNRLGAIK